MFYKRFDLNQNGGAHIVIAMLIASVSLVYFMNINKMYQDLNERAVQMSTKETLSTKMESIRTNLGNTDILYEVIGDNRNNFNCVLAGNCTYNKAPEPVYVSELDGNPLATPSGSGFDRHGAYCTSSESRCIFVIKVLWKPLCLSKADCSSPQIILYPEIEMNQKFSNVFQFNTRSYLQGMSAILDPETVLEKLRIKQAIAEGRSY